MALHVYCPGQNDCLEKQVKSEKGKTVNQKEIRQWLGRQTSNAEVASSSPAHTYQ